MEGEMVVLKREAISLSELHEERATFERRYGVPSTRLVEAFTVRGHLHETDDFHRWTHVHTLLTRFSTSS